MEVNIVQDLVAHWQWYHTAAVAIGAGLCVGGGILLIYFSLDMFFRE